MSISNVVVAVGAVVTTTLAATAAETDVRSHMGTGRCDRASEEFRIVANNSDTALDLLLAKGNPRRRLLVGSKGRLGVVVGVHDVLLMAATVPCTIGARCPPRD